jgi:uncharacterized protein involved in exopolysaccharide biosynthesis
MSSPYVETFSRHRRLLSIPIVVATLIAIWFAVGAAPEYESTTSLWFDNAPRGQSSLDQTNPALLTPAAEEQQLLNELLTTRAFRIKVGHRGPLAEYLAGHTSAGWGPTALLTMVRGTGSLDDRIVAALDTKQVRTTVAGPQLLAIKLKGPTPTVTAATLKALVREFNRQRSAARLARARTTLTYYKTQPPPAPTSTCKH